MASPIRVTGAAGRVGAVGRTVTELLSKGGLSLCGCPQATNLTLDFNGK